MGCPEIFLIGLLASGRVGTKSGRFWDGAAALSFWFMPGHRKSGWCFGTWREGCERCRMETPRRGCNPCDRGRGKTIGQAEAAPDLSHIEAKPGETFPLPLHLPRHPSEKPTKSPTHLASDTITKQHASWRPTAEGSTRHAIAILPSYLQRHICGRLGRIAGAGGSVSMGPFSNFGWRCDAGCGLTPRSGCWATSSIGTGSGEPGVANLSVESSFSTLRCRDMATASSEKQEPYEQV